MTVAIVRTEAAGRMESRKPALRGGIYKDVTWLSLYNVDQQKLNQL